jgi:V-type H+-transporting ATPase subunit a
MLEARYLLLIMGIMSTWAGLIYNEFFAIPMNLFGSCYKFNDPVSKKTWEPIAAGNATEGQAHTVIWQRLESRCVYPFG